MANVNKLFLQSMLSRGAVPETLARKIWQKCIVAVNTVDDSRDIPLDDNDESWSLFVNAINHSLDKLDLALRAVRDQRTGQAIFSIVNMKGDDIAQTATDYTPAEIAYFKAIVEQIMLAPRHKYSVSSLVALREVSMIKPKSNITKSQAEIVLASFVAKGWLIKSKDGRYSLSSRSLLELRPYLQSNYAGHILVCSICEEMLTMGIACYSEGCKCCMHPYCFKRFTRVRASGALHCKNCNEEWPRDFNSDQFIPIGDRAIRKGEHEQRVRMSSASDEDEHEDDEDEGIGSQSQSQPTQQPTQTQSRRGRKPKTQEKNTVDEDGEGEGSGPPAPTQSRPRRSARR